TAWGVPVSPTACMLAGRVSRVERVAVPRHVLPPACGALLRPRLSRGAQLGTRVASLRSMSANPLTLAPNALASATLGATLRAALVNIGLVGVSLALACGLGEMLVRIVAPQQLIVKRPDIWQPVDTLGWNHRPDV